MNDKPKVRLAEDLRAIAEAAITTQVRAEYSAVLTRMKSAAAAGKFHITVEGKLSQGTHEWLKKEGCSVSHYSGDQREPADRTTIRWKK